MSNEYAIAITMVSMMILVLSVTLAWLYFRHKTRAEAQMTIRAALEKGQELSPALLEKVMQPVAIDRRTVDLRRGVILVAVAIAIALLGTLGPGSTERALAISALPLVLGLAYLACAFAMSSCPSLPCSGSPLRRARCSMHCCSQAKCRRTSWPSSTRRSSANDARSVHVSQAPARPIGKLCPLFEDRERSSLLQEYCHPPFSFVGARLVAQIRRVVQTIVGAAALQIAVGGALGGILAMLSIDLREVLASRLPDAGAWVLPAVLGLLVAAALSATYLPLRRALRLQPSEALRAE